MIYYDKDKKKPVDLSTLERDRWGYYILRNGEYYVYNEDKILAEKDSRIYAYENSRIYAKKDSIVFVNGISSVQRKCNSLYNYFCGIYNTTIEAYDGILVFANKGSWVLSNKQ